MNPRYKQTIARHRLLLSVPIALATFIALWSVIGAPKAYESATALWVDTPPPGISSLENTNTSILTPSAQAQQLLSELLVTRHFRVAIGHEGPLARYLASHSNTGWGPMGLYRTMRGTGSVDDRVFAALGTKNVVTAIPGPQVLAVSLRGPTGPVAVGSLKALVDQLNLERKNLDVNRQEASMTYYKNQVTAAQASLAAAKTNLANGGAPGSTADHHQLAQAEHVAEARLKTATRAFNQASLNLDAVRAEKGIFRVIDPIRLPAKAVTGKKKMLFALVAGLFVGGLLSFLGTVVLSNREQRAEGEAELRAVLAAADAGPPREPNVVTSNGSPPAPTIAAVEDRA